MTSARALINENRKALLFIAKFVGFYIVLNVLYGVFVEAYYPAADPVTIFVANNTVSALSLFYDGLSTATRETIPFVTVFKGSKPVLHVFEGCNAINVVIVFVVFVFAFSSKSARAWKFLAGGILLLYVVNLLRVALLFYIALNFPESMYFFHKFFFTGIIYVVVLFLWYLWVKKVNQIESRAE